MHWDFGGVDQEFPVRETSFMRAFASPCQYEIVYALEPNVQDIDKSTTETGGKTGSGRHAVSLCCHELQYTLRERFSPTDPKSPANGNNRTKRSLARYTHFSGCTNAGILCDGVMVGKNESKDFT